MADGGIEAFWRWWATARHRVLDAIEVKRAFAPDAALKRIDHLLATHHLAVELPVVGRDAAGMPTREEAARLDALEDELGCALGEAVHLGRETVPGLRVLHFCVEEDAPAIAAARAWAAPRGAAVRRTHDPCWEAARRLGAG